DGNGKSVAVQFSEGQKIASWPSDLPVAAGSRYSVKGPGGGAQPTAARVAAGWRCSGKGSGDGANLTVRWIAPVPAGLEGLAQSFIRNDCQAQLDVLIDTFASPSARSLRS